MLKLQTVENHAILNVYRKLSKGTPFDNNGKNTNQ